MSNSITKSNGNTESFSFRGFYNDCLIPVAKLAAIAFSMLAVIALFILNLENIGEFLTIDSSMFYLIPVISFFSYFIIALSSCAFYKYGRDITLISMCILILAILIAILSSVSSFLSIDQYAITDVESMIQSFCSFPLILIILFAGMSSGRQSELGN